MNGTLKTESEVRTAGLTADELRRRAAERGRLRYLEKIIPRLIRRQRAVLVAAALEIITLATALVTGYVYVTRMLL